MMAASFYIFVGVILLLFSAILYYFTSSAGYKFLAIGFFMIFIYCIGKGSVMFYYSRTRYSFYMNTHNLNAKLIQSEAEYTEYRITKKGVNRRRYVWTTVVFTVLAFVGIFSPQKAIWMGTAIPIALISGIELGVGLLTEFRLREFLRILKKSTQI